MPISSATYTFCSFVQPEVYHRVYERQSARIFLDSCVNLNLINEFQFCRNRDRSFGDRPDFFATKFIRSQNLPNLLTIYVERTDIRIPYEVSIIKFTFSPCITRHTKLRFNVEYGYFLLDMFIRIASRPSLYLYSVNAIKPTFTRTL